MAIKPAFDVVIIGGAVIGSAAAYFLSKNADFNGTILVVEKDDCYTHSSTALSFSSIRTQFSNPVNIKLSQFGIEFIRHFPQLMRQSSDQSDLDFKENGYLILAQSDVQAAILKANHHMQIEQGADVVLLDAAQIKQRYPHLNIDDIQLASLGRSGEGWFDNMGLLNGLRRQACYQGVQYIEDQVVKLKTSAGKITHLQLASGKQIICDCAINAAGASAAQIASMLEISLPVEARKRSCFVFDCENPPIGELPLMIDSSKVFCRPEGRYFLAGCEPVKDRAVDLNDFDVRHDEFEQIIWPALAHRSANFEAIKLVNYWAGHYAYNRFDQNAIIGLHPNVSNFYFANGFSGHGLQQAPAIGRGLSELIVYNEYRTLDLRQLGFKRVLENRPFYEKTII